MKVYVRLTNVSVAHTLLESRGCFDVSNLLFTSSFRSVYMSSWCHNGGKGLQQSSKHSLQEAVVFFFARLQNSLELCILTTNQVKQLFLLNFKTNFRKA